MFGLWGISNKLGVDSIGWKNTAILSTLSIVWVVPLLYLSGPPRLTDFNWTGTTFAVLAGLFSGVALVAFNLALTTGKSSVVIPISALYPIVSVMIALVFLHEKLTLTQSAGVILAIIAVVLISI
jgi:transporter family protein